MPDMPRPAFFPGNYVEAGPVKKIPARVGAPPPPPPPSSQPEHAARYTAALAALCRSPNSLAPALRVSASLARKWVRTGPPPEVLAWVEAMARLAASARVPQVKDMRGGKRMRKDSAGNAP